MRALHLGDLLVAVPALRALRRALPDHRIVLATTPALAPLVELTGAVDELLPTAAPDALTWDRPPPDVAVNLHGRGPQSHQALDALDPRRRIGFGAPGWDGPDFDEIAARHPQERERWCAMLAAQGIPADAGDLRLPPPSGVAPGRRVSPVLVHPGARHGSKRWPARRFAEVAAALNCPLTPVTITGTTDERELALAVAGAAGLAESRVLAGRTDLAQLCALVAGAALVVSGDTGVAHLAAAFGTPSVTLFGPVDPAQWGPPADGPHVVLGDPDLRHGDPFADDPDPALLAVGVGDVLRAAARLRDHPRSRTPARAAEIR
ncbi:glycosyl transferase [Pseudonocardia sp. MH-G8]|nr:glycosyl transferase [Pseudonocardia sp. MH-G8]